MSRITFCIPSKNNLRYLKNSIASIKQNSTTNPDIVVYVDSDNDGTEQWLVDNKITYLKNTSGKVKGIAYAYNRCIEVATTEIVCMFHADMVMGKYFDVNILKHLKPRTVVAGTRIEPPLHPPGPEKITKNFGLYPEDFNAEEFNSFVAKSVVEYEGKTTTGIFAPWAIYKADILDVGLHEEWLHSYHEDSDIFNRFVINGFTIIQTWEALVYHLTCRGGQFQDGIERVTADRAFHAMKDNAFRNYVRKWKVVILHDEEMLPIIVPRFKTAFVVANCTPDVLAILEPWCDEIRVDCPYEEYIVKEQIHTPFDLTKKIQPIDNTVPETSVTVLVDGGAINPRYISEFIPNIPFIVQQTDGPGVYNWEKFILRIKDLDPLDMSKPWFKS